MPYRLFTLSEVAEYLHLSKADVERLVRRDEIPVERQGARIMFRKNDVDAWGSQRILGFSNDRLRDYHQGSSTKAHHLSQRHAIVSELLRPKFIQPAMTSRTKPSVLRDMVALAEKTGLAYDPAGLLRSLKEREEMCSTALPGGIALLHPRHHEPYRFEDSFIAFGRTPSPIPFGSPDGHRTDLFFLICCQDDRIHLHVLARVCMMATRTQLLQRLRMAEDAETLHRAVLDSENAVVAML